jgi:hypothetical protein
LLISNEKLLKVAIFKLFRHATLNEADVGDKTRIITKLLERQLLMFRLEIAIYTKCVTTHRLH